MPIIKSISNPNLKIIATGKIKELIIDDEGSLTFPLVECILSMYFYDQEELEKLPYVDVCVKNGTTDDECLYLMLERFKTTRPQLANAIMSELIGGNSET